ncbi:hypothetical protein HZU67_08665 [Apis mellifera carnica]|nr:hypothetical protein HZU67_08665 [Apis mellifera carnica]
MRDTSDMMSEDSLSEDTMMDCEGDAGGLDELVDLATDVADSSPTIRVFRSSVGEEKRKRMGKKEGSKESVEEERTEGSVEKAITTRLRKEEEKEEEEEEARLPGSRLG